MPVVLLVTAQFIYRRLRTKRAVVFE